MTAREGIQSEIAARPGRGVLWMVVTGLLFVGVTSLVKLLGTRVPAPEAAFLRFLIGLVFMLPVIGTMRNLRLDRGTWALIGARGAFHTVAVALWFFAMARIPLADVTAMNYLSPVYVTLGAALFPRRAAGDAADHRGDRGACRCADHPAARLSHRRERASRDAGHRAVLWRVIPAGQDALGAGERGGRGGDDVDHRHRGAGPAGLGGLGDADPDGARDSLSASPVSPPPGTTR